MAKLESMDTGTSKKERIESIKDFLRKHSQDFGVVTNDEECRQLLEKIERSDFRLEKDRFYIVVNIREQKVTWSHGVARHLPYPDVKPESTGPGITFEDAIGIVHPHYIFLYLEFGTSAYKLSSEPKFKVDFTPTMQQYSIQFPVLGRNGQYLWVSQISTPLEMDEKNNLLSHLNCYTVIKPFNDDLFQSPSVNFGYEFNWRKDIEKELGATIVDAFFDEFLELTAKEIDLIKHYGRGTEVNSKETNIKQTAKMLRVSESTIMAYNKRIIEKVNTKLGTKFQTAKDASSYLGRLVIGFFRNEYS